MPRLEDKVAIITGGGTGIGEATCERFAQEGARVAIFDVDLASAEKTAERLRGGGYEAVAIRVDVTKEDTIAEGVRQVIDRWGKIDVLVNNAGIPGANKFTHEATVEEWDLVFAVNARGPFLCSKHVLPHMMAAKRGSIVNFSSIYGLIGNDDLPPYHATKGAVLMMTKTDAICYAPFGIRVNCVHPGSTKTPLFLKAGEPVDVANCVLFLASDEARFVTGASLVCDGGYTAQ